jgi:hypothetical protein
MWLVGFGLAVLCYWRHAGALNAFGLVSGYLVSGHDGLRFQARIASRFV